MSDVMPTVATSTADRTQGVVPESRRMVEQARQLLSERNAPMTAENLNRAMQMITQSADAPTDFSSMVEQGGNPTARPRGTAQLPTPPPQPTAPTATQGAASSGGSGTASVDRSAATTPAASGATQPTPGSSVVPPQIAAMLDGDAGGQMHTPPPPSVGDSPNMSDVPPARTATDSNGLTPAIPPQIAAMLDGDSGGGAASGSMPTRGAAPPTDLESALEPGVQLPSQQPAAAREPIRLRTGAEMLDDPIANIMARSLTGASGGMRQVMPAAARAARGIPVGLRPPPEITPAPPATPGVPRGTVPPSGMPMTNVAPQVPRGPLPPAPAARADVSPEAITGELRRLLSSRNPPSPNSLPARPAATPGGRPIEGATPPPSVNNNPAGPPAPPRGSVDPARVARESEDMADRVHYAKKTGADARNRQAGKAAQADEARNGPTSSRRRSIAIRQGS